MADPSARAARYAKQVDLDSVQDTLLVVHETVDGHTAAIEDVRTRVQALQNGQRDQHLRLDNVEVLLAAMRQVQREHGELLGQQGATLSEHSATLREQGEVLREQGEVLREQGEVLREQGEVLREHGELLRQQRATLSEHGTMLERILARVDDRSP